MNLMNSMELIKKYSVCPECGSDKIGNGEGALVIENNIFKRSCKCGWKIIEDHRIKCTAYITTKINGKIISGCYEVSIHGLGHKLLPLNELKELSGVKRVNQTKKIEAWLNTVEGREWALTVKEAKTF